jgi:hypothetical protein
MAKGRFELSLGKPNCVRAFTLEATVELESTDNQTAGVLVDVLNAFVSDIVVSTHEGPSLEIASPSGWLPV